jgi:hypothetical protein
MICVAVKVETECGTCRLPMPVNTLAREVSCASCGRPAALADDLWKALLRHPIHDGPKMLLQEGRSTSAGKLSAAYTRRAPSCQGCEKEIPVEDIREVREHATVTCARCAKRTWVRTVPAELAGALPSITHLVGEDPDPAAMASEGAAEAATFPCPQCGSPVPFDGVTRACVCRFCSASVHVPDDFVFRGRRKVAASWFLCFDPSITDGAPAAEAVEAGLFDWEDPPRAAVDVEGNLYCAVSQLDTTPSGMPKHHNIVWSMDPSMNVRWLQRGRPTADGLVLSPESKLLVTSRDRLAWAWLSSTSGTPVEEGAGVLAQARDDELLDCNHLSCDRNGTLLISKADRIRRFSASGMEVPVWRGGALGGVKPVDGISGLRCIQCGPDGSVYCMYRDEFARVDASGREMFRLTLSSDPPEFDRRPFGVDAAGNAYVVRRDEVIRIGVAGEQSVVLCTERDGQPRSPQTPIAVCPDGAFWLFGTKGRAWKFDARGTLLFESGLRGRVNRIKSMQRMRPPPQAPVNDPRTFIAQQAAHERPAKTTTEAQHRWDRLLGNGVLVIVGLVLMACIISPIWYILSRW